MKCFNCNKAFEAKRKTARFCSPKCRVYFSRSGGITAPTITVALPKDKRPDTPVPIPEVLGGPPDPNVRWENLCEHFAAKGMCKKSKCKYSMFDPKNRRA